MDAQEVGRDSSGPVQESGLTLNNVGGGVDGKSLAEGRGNEEGKDGERLHGE